MFARAIMIARPRMRVLRVMHMLAATEGVSMLKQTAFACLVLATGAARAQGIQTVLSPGSYISGYSRVVPNVATTVIPQLTSGLRVRVVALDTAIQAGSDPTVTTWCAWGTAAANPAVVGSNGFPLNPGFDDAATGVNQQALNCIQPSGSHYIRLEAY